MTNEIKVVPYESHYYLEGEPHILMLIYSIYQTELWNEWYKTLNEAQLKQQVKDLLWKSDQGGLNLCTNCVKTLEAIWTALRSLHELGVTITGIEMKDGQ